MIKVVPSGGNIFDSDCEYLVNPVNCVGVMGAGLAKGFKRKYPEHFEFYRKLCTERDIRVGEVTLDHKHKIILFPTKQHWKDKSRLLWIELGLKNLLKRLEQNWPEVKSIAFPALGCGLGGLSWDKEVLPLFLEILGNAEEDLDDIRFEVYAP